MHVVRCFENDNIVHVDGKINPANDIDTINTELLLSDMEVMERKIQKAEKMQSLTNPQERNSTFSRGYMPIFPREKMPLHGS